MKFCTECGSQNVKDANFCISCGNPFPKEMPLKNSVDNIKDNDTKKDNAIKNNKNRDEKEKNTSKTSKKDKSRKIVEATNKKEKNVSGTKTSANIFSSNSFSSGIKVVNRVNLDDKPKAGLAKEEIVKVENPVFSDKKASEIGDEVIVEELTSQDKQEVNVVKKEVNVVKKEVNVVKKEVGVAKNKIDIPKRKDIETELTSQDKREVNVVKKEVDVAKNKIDIPKRKDIETEINIISLISVELKDNEVDVESLTENKHDNYNEYEDSHKEDMDNDYVEEEALKEETVHIEDDFYEEEFDDVYEEELSEERTISEMETVQEEVFEEVLEEEFDDTEYVEEDSLYEEEFGDIYEDIEDKDVIDSFEETILNQEKETKHTRNRDNEMIVDDKKYENRTFQDELNTGYRSEEEYESLDDATTRKIKKELGEDVPSHELEGRRRLSRIEKKRQIITEQDVARRKIEDIHQDKSEEEEYDDTVINDSYYNSVMPIDHDVVQMEKTFKDKLKDFAPYIGLLVVIVSVFWIYSLIVQ